MFPKFGFGISALITILIVGSFLEEYYPVEGAAMDTREKVPSSSLKALGKVTRA